MIARGARRGDTVHAAWVLPALVVVTLAATGWLYVRGDLNSVLCEGPCGPQYVTPPAGLVTAVAEPAQPAEPGSGPIDADELAQAVAEPLTDEALGGRVGLTVLDARSGAPLIDRGSAHTPASTTKLLTATAVLALRDPDSRFTTSVVRDGDRLVLVGGGDPYLTEKTTRRDRLRPADLASLAADAAERVGAGPVTVGYDDSLFTGPAVSPAWEPGYVGGVVAPVSALWIDRGRVGQARSTDPAGDAARAFVEQLRAAGVRVEGSPERVAAPAGVDVVAQARSAPLHRIVEQFTADSDNEVAEALLRHAALAAGRPASFAGGVEAVTAVLSDAGVSTESLTLHDGSGLSRRNRISTLTLAQTMAHVAATPRLSAIASGLPVGGFSGTLSARYGDLDDALGLVRAKTGTLTGVHTLAGFVTLSDGRPAAFALMADDTEGINPFVTQAALDRAAAAIATCPCA